jgi:hypothetical protein
MGKKVPHPKETGNNATEGTVSDVGEIRSDFDIPGKSE